ncbi:MAG: dephospho-CoA kinase [Saprospiraceae bacterium]|nr:dephospho-CoA kinase [Saprospiraceae bacterium]
MQKIALTGGIGSGKSFVASIFELFGIPVYHADREAKRLMYQNRELKTKIKSIFGKKAYYRNGRPDRRFIASRVFNNKTLLRKLEGLIHPAVQTDFRIWAESQHAPYVIEESALIHEIKAQSNFDKIILVIADKETRIERVMKRDGSTREQVLKRMKEQLPDQIKIRQSDYIINNNGDESLIRQILKIHRNLQRL